MIQFVVCDSYIGHIRLFSLGSEVARFDRSVGVMQMGVELCAGVEQCEIGCLKSQSSLITTMGDCNMTRHGNAHTCKCNIAAGWYVQAPGGSQNCSLCPAADAAGDGRHQIMHTETTSQNTANTG